MPMGRLCGGVTCGRALRVSGLCAGGGSVCSRVANFSSLPDPAKRQNKNKHIIKHISTMGHTGVICDRSHTVPTSHAHGSAASTTGTTGLAHGKRMSDRYGPRPWTDRVS